MPNALSTQGPTFAQAAPDVGGIPGGVIPVSPGPAANPLSAPQGPQGAAQIAPGASGPQPQQGPPQPAPTHEQTVAALHHMSIVTHEFMGLMKDPDFGKKDMRSQIVDSMLELVQRGIATVPSVVEQIKQVPADAQGQKNWIQQHLLGNQLAGFALLEHYRAANPPTFNVAAENAHRSLMSGGKKKSHGDIIGGLMSHYRGPR